VLITRKRVLRLNSRLVWRTWGERDLQALTASKRVTKIWSIRGLNLWRRIGIQVVIAVERVDELNSRLWHNRRWGDTSVDVLDDKNASVVVLLITYGTDILC
jgi:hypothetical protein